MHAKVNLDEIDVRELDDGVADLKSVGMELRPQQMRPNVWVFEAGERLNRHYQEEQEELYHVLSGEFELRYEDETDELVAGDIVVVSPEEIRQLVCVEPGEVFVVGAPATKDDGVVVEE
ncbi:Cupin domain protein [Halogranum gelatinilyticum]|uniref:Cupin domain protein n=1 Tax=Halogranum gelatinilyticum TaxID=660521 RepID=A0A1G9Z8J4_9EURY|nr:cupin domain-containing protein [Halogranum gelatinilyticum]SDN17654.1 Cupin domain protein [Halogranum gelatinilyticum]